MAVSKPRFGNGVSALQTEDKAFVQGHGQFTHDISVPSVLHAFVRRSREAAATLAGRSIKAALAGKDYAIPRAHHMPNFMFQTRSVPSIINSLAITRAGEAATIASTHAVINAVVDAVWRPYGIGRKAMPATLLRMWETVQNAKAVSK